MALIFAFIAVFAFGNVTGATIISWKTGAKIAKLESNDAVVTAANERCANDVTSVKAGVKVITDAVDKREKAASEAMKAADLLVEKHKAAQEQIAALPPVAPENQCEAIIAEQVEYVASRKVSE